MALARIGLGANLGDPVAACERACEALAELGIVRRRSSLYRTPAWGPVPGPEFGYAAALLETALGPHELLAALKALERRLGRVPRERWGAREIDLDILAYDELALREPDLELPHPRLLERAFALVPLAEIDPAYAGALARLPAAERTAVQRIPPEPARTANPVEDAEIQRVRWIAAFAADSGLARLAVEDGPFAIEVRGRPRAAVHGGWERGAVTASGTATNGAIYERPRATVRADFVGIVRFARPAVAPGSEVTPERELAFVESLGVRNPIHAPEAGRIAEVLVSDGEPVDYGRPLFVIEPCSPKY